MAKKRSRAAKTPVYDRHAKLEEDLPVHLRAPETSLRQLRQGNGLGRASTGGPRPHVHHVLLRQRGVPEGNPLPPDPRQVRRCGYPAPRPADRRFRPPGHPNRDEGEGEIPEELPAQADGRVLRPCVREGYGMNFGLSPEHVALRDMVRSFVAKEVRPHARRWDEESAFPADTVARMGELGLMGVMVPEEYGGSGMDTISYSIAV